ncbi:DEAD/DEAH box helicase [Polaromonas naphthalenivorans]|uniref:DNA 3'-5' helicase II n=1 Tax=Polaromonas naphthalenivorans (strain CJ2) TaxID=365044 RepID=A1VUE1_POLNA|nr:NERD domain-containing protein/DEAD/DEAH box helicase [Polaromonas naphthalenivorans]ABM39269.1 conserved hypothetical protein [Polaromonas naphthalenivorans CJ2]
MAKLIPAIGSCLPRMTSGERRLAERLEQQLDNDCLLWYDVPVGPKQSHPDFVLMHPRHGILILETKDWKLETIRQATRQAWDIQVGRRIKVVMSPLAQARFCAIQVVNALERDPQLVQAEGGHRGKLAFAWGYGVVFTHITRQQFNAAGLGEAIEPHYVICQDEMLESGKAEAFQQRLWAMFAHAFGGGMSAQQLDRVRWNMFPQVRVQTQSALFNDNDPDAEFPGILRMLDLQQEQLARSLGDGHRVIHGVAGSGKTMILGYRAEYLAQSHTADSKPILILCYNEALAVKLASVMDAKGLSGKVHALHFHKWCRDQLVAHGQELPARDMPVFAKMDEMVLRVIHGVDSQQIPAGQYQAVLIDEGHDFAPEWLRLATQMVDPATKNLLLLYDDAQSIYERGLTRHFSFKSVGIQAQGRTTILKINYRNTRQILQTASLVAGGLLLAADRDDDGIPRLKPISGGRDGQAPQIFRLPNRRAEALKIAELLNAAHHEGHAWNDMAVICRRYDEMDDCAQALSRWKLPHQVRRGSGSFHPDEDTIKVLTMHASKGLEFAVVALMGVGQMPAEGEDEGEEARLFYVGATRATGSLIVTASADSRFFKQIKYE